MANSLNTITVDGITYDAAKYAADHITTKANDELGKDAFLQLLVAQMKYQDPLDPQDNSEYIAELANFSALEQMTNVASNLEKLSTVVNNIDTSVLVGQLSSMIGKGINWLETTSTTDSNGNATASNETLKGWVKGINILEGNPTVIAQYGDKLYNVSISDITRVFEPEVSDETDDSTSQSNSSQNAYVGELV